MRCHHCQEALSALIDGEAPGVDRVDVEAHLADCTECRAFAAGLDDLHRSTRVRAAEPVPDLTAAIMARVPTEARPPRLVARGLLREGLVFVGLLLVAASLVTMAQAAPAGDHTPAWDLAFAAGLLVAAWQPDRSRGLLPMAAALVVTMSGAAIIHLANGHPAGHGAVVHALELTGVVALWGLSRVERGWTGSPGRLASAA